MGDNSNTFLIDCKKCFTFFLTLPRSTHRTRRGSSRGGGLTKTAGLTPPFHFYILSLIFTGDTIVASLCIGNTTSRTCITGYILTGRARIRRTTVQTRSTTLCIVSGNTSTRYSQFVLAQSTTGACPTLLCISTTTAITWCSCFVSA